MINQKRKGNQWERDAAKELNKNFPDVWKRIAMSGAMGTHMDVPLLKADVVGKYPFIEKQFVGECKVGYGGKQMTIRKDWFDHIADIAKESYSYPLVILKFDYARAGVRHVVCMDFEVWDSLLTEIEELRTSLRLSLEELNGETG
jgi:Holliday junction resolvase